MGTQWYVCERCLTPALISVDLPVDRPVHTACTGCHEIRLAYPLDRVLACMEHDVRAL